ncbi:DNA internalization-related competence protein ComEC/Rec2 [Neiella sp. HB171785]|uniref:DNA internalization-related competence protein ComEC/Rec2 n=1 Tax=Neiella litorisoli TaxID=2771431 RepID=A0A8J6QK42_9GAMM|nr:DNA internalization-related competence protein ComEC/Rec2 [Neiella litorisoli]MBD1389651.1 DNA internalization-related competence protein ComEC/Rec2 [Neiella litorisoli]
MLIIYVLTALSANWWPDVLPRQAIILCVALTCICLLVQRGRRIGLALAAMVVMSDHALTYRAAIYQADQLSTDISLSIQMVRTLTQQDAIEILATTDALDRQMYLKLRWYRPTQPLTAGQTLIADIVTKPPHELANLGGFSYRRYLLGENIVATGTIKTVKQVSSSPPNLNWMSSLRSKLGLAIAPYQRADVLAALVIGDRSSLSHDVRQAFIDTGTAHLMAISGLHIGMVFGASLLLLSGLSRLLFSQYSATGQLYCAVAAFFVAALYAALSGFALPTVRAIVFLAIWLVVKACHWQISGWRLLWLTAALFITVAPQTAYSVSFWLSFTAVAGVFVSLKVTQAWQLRRISKLAVMQLVIVASLVPVQVALFNQQSSLAPLVNLLAIPWLGVAILPLALSGALISLLHPSLGHLLLVAADWQLQLMVALLMPLANWQGQLVQLDWASLVLMLVLLAVVLMMVLLSKLPSRRWLLVLAMVSNVVIVAAVYRHWRVAPTVDVLDVGQGLSVIARYQEVSIVYDVGASYPSGFNMADAVINPYIAYQGIDHINWLILSHDDNDHAGSAAHLSARLTIESVLTSFAPVALPHHEHWQFHHCHDHALASHTWQIGQLTMINLTSPVAGKTSDNDMSCVVKLVIGEASLLLPGDISRGVESQLRAADVDVGLLIAPHHGSKTSSSRQFIELVSPQIAVFSAGFRNRWQLPNELVAERYQQFAITTYASSEYGMMRFTAAGEHWQMTPFCQLIWPSWYRCQVNE